MSINRIYDEVVHQYRTRGRLIAGLAVAVIDMFKALDVPSRGLHSFEEFKQAFHRQERVNGRRANTLVVQPDPSAKAISLRPFYNAIDQYFRDEQKRYDYPHAPGHATQLWGDYEEWYDEIVTWSHQDLNALRERIVQFVLDDLPSQAFDPSTVRREPPLFEMILSDFDVRKHGKEPTGAAYQGLVFGFVRADNPHLQFEIRKVRAGSKRLRGVGDVDGWDAGRLALSAEVKQYTVGDNDVTDLLKFAHEVNLRGAIGMVVALDFAEGVRHTVESNHVHALSRADILRIVRLWDPLKQRTAVSSALYYFEHVEQNSSLTNRVVTFLDGGLQKWRATRKGSLSATDEADEDKTGDRSNLTTHVAGEEPKHAT